MLATIPEIQPAILAISSFAERHASDFSSDQQQTLLEVRRRLRRLEVLATELIEINNRLWSLSGLEVDFDPETETINMSFGGETRSLKINRADPNVPVKVDGQTSSSAYHAGAAGVLNEEEASLRLVLEEKLEGYYQSAHRVIKLLGTLPPFAKLRCLPITLVRNKLIEHPETGALYSFGFGSSGPRVKPMKRDSPSYNDEGLVPNTRAFVDAIVSACAKHPNKR